MAETNERTSDGAVEPGGADQGGDADRRLVAWGVALVVGFFFVDSFFRAAYFYFGARAVGADPPPLDPVLSEITGSLATLVVFFLVVIPVTTRHPLVPGRWKRSLPAHALGFLVFTTAKTLLMWAQRTALWPVADLGSYDYGTWGYRITMEAANDVFGYGLLVAGVQLFQSYRSRRDRELRRARLETRLHQAQLEALQGRLQPHFLFNTLNTISSVMYADPGRADRMIARLSDLLRSSLAAPERPEVSVEEELELLARYVDLMRARFGDRLEVDVDLAPDARGVAVPVFLLQPLVENAIQHGVSARAGPGRVEVSVTARDGQVVVRVRDDGPGPPPGPAPSDGVGLRSTRDRLRLLHGDRALLTLGRAPEGGAVVEVRFPLSRAEISERHVEAR
ncbi:MAG TPA: histidine kinase, partial [Candidatus Limnocylindrales bacterium]|nr:histidine kinase [Candidatus Limnocylindrales bacterium]